MRAVITLGGQAVETEEEDETDTIKPLPDRLVSELTAHCTLALRDAVAVNPHVAKTALLHRLVMDCFMPHSSRGCLEAQVREVHLPRPRTCAIVPRPRPLQTGTNAGAIMFPQTMLLSGIG